MTAVSTSLTPARLAKRAQALADRPEEWIHRVRLSTDGRWYERLHADGEYEVWLISWLPGQSTGFHDHGGSAGAFAVALGELAEHGVSRGRTVATGQSRGFGPGYVHDVRNESQAPSVSIHVYSPPLSTIQRYDLDGEGRLIPLALEQTEDW